ncbi:MAG TPA: DUF342 domain-containing protein, partial [Desulfobulbaceae bacterium]|nr:DUF342 domain-containing protein [Desulfobulbaceae bacterium]
MLRLHLTRENMTATIQELDVDTGELTDDGLARDLKKQGISFGVDDRALRKVVSMYNQSGRLENSTIIAQGKEPVTGSTATLQPHFKTALLAIQENDSDSSHQLEISELMTCGDLVALLESPRPGKEGMTVTGLPVAPDEPPEIELTIGEHLDLDEQTGRITAGASGYPEILVCSKKNKVFMEIKLTPAVTIDSEKMVAELFLFPPLPGDPIPDRDQVIALLAEQGVIFGMNIPAIDELITRFATTHPLDGYIPVARGMMPVHGQDSHLRFVMDVGPIPGKIQPNGEIDFRERQLFIGIREGEIIAVRMAATPGEPGKNLLGEIVAPVPGRELPVKVSDDACFDEQTGEVRAVHSGVLSITGDNTIKVCAMQIISGDVNYGTGNISTRDALKVSGSVKPLFTVSANGDVDIEGNVESALIASEANIIVKGGILGEKSRLQAAGDIDINFIEHGRAFSDASIILRREAYYSRLHAGGDLHCDKNSRVIGGQLVAAGQITCGTIGSVNAQPGFVAAGVQPKKLQRMFDLQRKREKFEKKLVGLPSKSRGREPSKKLARLAKKFKKTTKYLNRIDLTETIT